MNNLQLTLHKEWFDVIASGVKKEEYRENKPYWQLRLPGKSYDEVHFRNGYGRDKPFMRVKCLGIVLDKAKNHFVIKLGEILEIKNYSPNT
jgi:hypothetical protein